MTNGGVAVARKVNINFDGLKLNDSKKRTKGTSGQQDITMNGDQTMETSQPTTSLENSNEVETKTSGNINTG